MVRFTSQIFALLQAGGITREEAESRIKRMQEGCFGILLPIVDILQEMISREEAAGLYETFEWMEQPEQMADFLDRQELSPELEERMEQLLENRAESSRLIAKYEKELSK